MALELRNPRRPEAQADQEDRGDDHKIDAGRLRLLRQLRRGDRLKATRGAPHRDAVHRLQDAPDELRERQSRSSALRPGAPEHPPPAGRPMHCIGPCFSCGRETRYL